MTQRVSELEYINNVVFKNDGYDARNTFTLSLKERIELLEVAGGVLKTDLLPETSGVSVHFSQKDEEYKKPAGKDSSS